MRNALVLLSALALSAATWSKIQSQVQSQLAKLSDAQVLGVLTAANDAELDAARLAQAKAADPHVKGFAEHMSADHSASNTEVGALARRLNISPQTSAESGSLTQTAKSEKDVPARCKARRSIRPTWTAKSPTIKPCSTRSTRRFSPARRAWTSRPCSRKLATWSANICSPPGRSKPS